MAYFDVRRTGMFSTALYVHYSTVPVVPAGSVCTWYALVVHSTEYCSNMYVLYSVHCISKNHLMRFIGILPLSK